MSGNQYFDTAKTLKWSDELGMGYLPLSEKLPYDAEYFKKYVEYEDSDIGRSLNNARLMAVLPLIGENKTLVDVGIGSGQFMNAAQCLGYDINPVAVNMLIERGRYFDPFSNTVQCASFWDSLEHIPNISELLANVTDYVFTSLPIFDDIQHVRRSKHFRPDEHCWYFTHDGFCKFMNAHGFKVLTHDTVETILGREDIGTYTCKRVN